MEIKGDNNSYSGLKSQISELLLLGREQAGRAINTILVQTYWQIGRHIVEFEQDGKDKAEYGSNLLNRLSKDLSHEFGKGFGRSNLFYIRKLYLSFQNSGTLSHKLGWSHYYEILKSDEPLEIGFYTKQCEKENWSVRELKRQMKSMLFHRIAISKDKQAILSLSEKGAEIETPSDIIKDPFVFEFLGIPDSVTFTEGELESKLIQNLQDLLLELSKGFAFIGRQYRISLGYSFFRSFGLTQKNQRVKICQSSYHTRPNAGSLANPPTAPFRSIFCLPKYNSKLPSHLIRFRLSKPCYSLFYVHRILKTPSDT